jgi:ribosome-binding factor A
MSVKRLEAHVRSCIAPILLTIPKECSIVSLTEVELTADAEYITVYVSALQHPERALQYLRSKQRMLQRSLAVLGKKHLPLLRFCLDPRTEKGERIDRLLKEA